MAFDQNSGMDLAFDQNSGMDLAFDQNSSSSNIVMLEPFSPSKAGSSGSRPQRKPRYRKGTTDMNRNRKGDNSKIQILPGLFESVAYD